MEHLDLELLDVWKTLNACHVKYIMVGSFATHLHGFDSRCKNVIDIWVEDGKVNRANLQKAFIDLGTTDHDLLNEKQFIPGIPDFSIGGIELDIRTSMKAGEELSFEECLAESSIANFEGIEVPFLNIDHLIQYKIAINRPIDKIDVVELQRIKGIRVRNAGN